MLQGWVIGVVSIAYLGALFGIAWYSDRRADQGRSLIANPYVYSLSLGVYATSWTFYGSVGRAASSGIGFLPIYLGPTLVAALWFVVVGKIVAIAKANRITSIADFIGSRYGKSALLAGLVTVIAVVGIVPYISLQLKAVSNSFTVLTHYPDIAMPAHLGAAPVLTDTAFYVALLLAAFAILFGTRHLDAAERHEGMVAAIAFESVVKLVAFLAVGLFVTFGIYRGFGDVFARAAADPELAALLTMPREAAGGYVGWTWLIVLSMFAIVFLPRQFQVAVVENVDPRHLRQASWLFPLYLLAINLFVLPIALGGLLHFPGGEVDADMFVLALPMAEHQQLLALAVFLGGLSAATGMVIVETVALSTMVSNDLVMPLLLRFKLLDPDERGDVARRLLAIRRSAIVGIVLLGYVYFRFAGEAYALVAIGLISFAAVAQFAPAMLGGIYWKHGTRTGAVAGLAAGFTVWAYTLLLPSFARSGWLPQSFLDQGPWGLQLLRPLELFGLGGLDQTTHAMVWSMLANISVYVLVSLLGRPDPVTRAQAERFVDVSRSGAEPLALRRGQVSLRDLEGLLARFLGAERTRDAFAAYARRRGADSVEALAADAGLVGFAETQLAGAIGSASARVMVGSLVKEEAPGLEEVMSILDETSQAIAYSKALEQKSRELEAATAELRAANERLQELDRMKDDFVSTVSHELRTPLTSIRAFAELLFDRPDTPPERRRQFLGIILKETERLTRLINQILDLAKIESGRADWHTEALDMRELVRDATAATSQLFADRGVALEMQLPEHEVAVVADRDRLQQVLLNLLSNAVKFSPNHGALVRVALRLEPGRLRIDVSDNGPGIDPRDHESIFEKFRQAGDTLTGKPHGTGLGLPISRRIVRQFGGELWVESVPGEGATFSFTLPLASAAGGQ
jgi:Na+/proline symporter/nitrogen-specific signal transduction histidine kinase